ncbi:hypothetical protein AMJ50_01740 [Parcubacteria bacterium DG_74_3]|nr:MAG: hypothetical protein AMJ50_01740 [Parcubacteria bacterium DG_74_3]
MALTKEQKEKILKNLKEKIARRKAMIFVDFSGLKVKDLSDLRQRLKQAKSELLVAKKTLMKIAFKEVKVKTDPKEIKGEIALVFGFEDEISPAKVVYQFSQENENLEILGGYIESQKDEFLDAEKMITLGQLPTKKELLANLVRVFSAPTTNLVNVLEGNLKGLIYALSAIKR